LRVPDKHLIPSWDLLVVLRALTGPPFEPLETVDIKFVSLKIALLLALASAKRVGDMQALSVNPSYLQFSIAGDKVVMRPNAAYTPKVVATPFRNQVIELAVVSPSPFAPAEEERLNKLRAHSTRGVSSSWALLKGVSVEEICKAASWSSRHTFIRFYMLDVAEPSFLHGVLQASDL